MYIKWNGAFSGSLIFTKGVKQGGGLSLSLFNPIRSGEGGELLNPPPLQNFCLHAVNSGSQKFNLLFTSVP